MTTSPSPDLLDELSALSAIYPPETLPPSPHSPIPPPSILHALSDGRYLLHLPLTPPITLHLTIPSSYPSEPPQILDPPTLTAASIARDILATVFRPGEVVFFDLIESCLELLQAEPPAPADDSLDTDAADSEESDQAIAHYDDTDSGPSNVDMPPWHISPSQTIKKSLFIARCIPVSTATEAKSHLAAVFADRRLKKATHNISAYRIVGKGGRVVQDNDDDGETAAGGRLGWLLEMMGVGEEEVGDKGKEGSRKGKVEEEGEGRGALVVVSRWYGGVKLGPARFGIINNCARECLVEAGFGKEEKKGKKGKK